MSRKKAVSSSPLWKVAIRQWEVVTAANLVSVENESFSPISEAKESTITAGHFDEPRQPSRRSREKIDRDINWFGRQDPRSRVVDPNSISLSRRSLKSRSKCIRILVMNKAMHCRMTSRASAEVGCRSCSYITLHGYFHSVA